MEIGDITRGSSAVAGRLARRLKYRGFFHRKGGVKKLMYFKTDTKGKTRKMKSRFFKGISLLLTTAILSAGITIPSFAEEISVYEISTPEELAQLGGKDIKGKIELLSDIDMSNVETEPIKSLEGDFAGNGYIISNLTISDISNAALIANLDGTVSDVIVENPDITLTSMSGQSAAAIAGNVSDESEAVFTNCAVIGGAIVDQKGGSSTAAGALVGNVTNSTVKIDGCFSTAAVTGNYYAGGLIGKIYAKSAQITNSAVLGDVTSKSSYSGKTGGFIGLINGSSNTIGFENCYFAGKVTGRYKYGFAASSSYAHPAISVQKCYYDGEKNKGSSAYSPFECFSSDSDGAPEKIEKTEDFASLDMGEKFLQKEGYPYPAWYVNMGGDKKLSLTVIPQDALVTLTDEQGAECTLDGNDGTYSATLACGRYSLNVIPNEGDEEHSPQNITVNMGRVDKNLRVELTAKTYELTFDIAPETAEVVLYRGIDASGEKLLAENGKYILTKGEYYYEVSDFGYKTKSGALSLSEDKTETVVLEKSERHELTFRVYPTSSDAAITLTRADGDKREMQGENGVYLLPEGSYDYKITAEGYKTKNGTLLIPGTDNITVTLVSGNSWDGTLSEILDGSGTEEDPYKIKSGNDLAFAAQKVNDSAENYASASYVLEDDVDLGYMTWMPIGKTSVAAFKGSFDGNGHKISGMNVSDKDNSVYAYYGLFGCLDDAEVKNLTVEGEIYCGETSGYAGGIAGSAVGNTTVENCANAALISAKAGVSVGGIVGKCRKSSDIGYGNDDNTVKFINCVNKGVIFMSGEDKSISSEGTAGGIVGFSKNCVQFENCANFADVTGANIAAGICGDPGSSQGNMHPYFKSCYNTGSISGVQGAYAIYGKDSMSRAFVTNCYSVSASNKYVIQKTAEEMKTDSFKELIDNGQNVWQRDDAVNSGYPYPFGVNIPENDSKLTEETQKYKDILTISSDAEVGDCFGFIKDGMTADSDIAVSCVQTDKESYLTRLGNGAVKLKKKNDSGAAVVENVTLLFVGNGGMMRRDVTVIINPEKSSRAALVDNIARLYASKALPDEWVVFDMAAYNAMKNTGDMPKISEDAKQNYINVAIDGLNKSYTLPNDRAKAEIIMGAIGVDTTKLYPVNSNTPINNAALLKNENFGADYTAAVWALLADMQGNVSFTKAQIENLVDILIRNQKEDGLFSYTYGLNTFADPDTTGTALAAIARFYLSENDSYGIKTKVKSFADKAVDGLSAALGENGSYGNINSDAMVITGLLALGIDPSSDSRFIKNGCALADAPMLYVNSAKNGFVSAYMSGSTGEKYSAMATEQGFRGITALEAFEKNGKNAYNIYAFNTAPQDGEPIKKTPVRATGTGSVELPQEPSESADKISVNLDIKALNNSWYSGTAEVKEGSTVYQLLKKAAEANNIEVAGLEKGYVRSMSYNGQTFSEFDKGKSSGWLYYVNGELPLVGITDYVLSDGDKVEFLYTADYKQEQGGSLSGGKRGTSAGGNSSKDDSNTTEPPANTVWENIYRDVSKDAWYYNAVEYVCKNNLFKGVSDTEFAPDENMTRAMLVTVLYRMENAENTSDKSKFTDVPDGEWYTDAVNYAAANGIVTGISDTEFAPNANVTREQTAAILYRYAKMKGYDVSGAAELSVFSDADTISDWAVVSFKWANKAELISGVSDTELSPKSNTTRVQLAAILMRFLEMNTK